MNVCSDIETAKKCLFTAAKQRVNEVTFGLDSDDSSLYKLLGIKAQLEALKNYEDECTMPCLTDEEVCLTIEKLNKICLTCNCNCN